MDREAEQQREIEVGELLRSQRLRLGLSISEASNVLCIREAYLEAIENGRFADLPGATYVAGFIRTYSEHLGLDGKEVVRQLKAEPRSIDSGSELRFPSPLSEGGMPTGAILLLGVFVALVAYGAWYVISTRDDSVAELISPLPERLVAFLRDGEGTADGEKTAQRPGSAGTLVPRPTDRAAQLSADERAPAPVFDQRANVTRPNETAADGVSSSPTSITREREVPVPDLEPENGSASDIRADDTRDVSTAADDGNSRLAPDAQDTRIISTPAANGDSGGQEAARPVSEAEPPAASGARIVLRATNENWVEIHERTTNRRILAKLLKPGETFDVPNDLDLRLLTGNAGGLEILVDGVRVPRLGAEGVVRRNVPLDASQLRSGTLARN